MQTVILDEIFYKVNLMNFDFSYFVSVFPEIVTYLPTTLFIAIISIVIAIIVGLFIAFNSSAKNVGCR